MNTCLTAMDDNRVRSEHAAGSRYAFAAVGLAVFAMWALLHPYWGIEHDSILYTYAALARLHPESLAQDVFLRFGSQDRYTLFSPLYAGSIRLLGLEPAAAILTFVAQLAFFGCAWQLARRLMNPRLACLAVGLLVVLPSGYGAYQIFHYTEEFLTPREFAEACVLAALAAAAARQRVLTYVALGAGLLLHPVMGAAGVAMLLTLDVAIPRPRLALVLGIGGLAAFLAIAALAPVGPLARIDDLWRSLLEARSPFLFIERWALDDWSRALIPLGVLAVGYSVCRDEFVRKLCLASLIIAASGLALTVIGSDLMRILIVTQAQPWRWLWLSSALAVLLVPLVARDAWQLGPLGRTSLILLATSWMFRAEASALIVSALAVISAIASRYPIDLRRARLLYRGSMAVGLLGLLFSLMNNWLAVRVDPDFLQVKGGGPPALQLVRFILADGIVVAGVLLLLWWIAFKSKARAAPAIASVVALAGCVAMIPFGWQSWSATSYPAALYAKYADWRARIPVGSEVFWPDDPLGPPYLLERASYISTAQTAGMVFSRDAAMEMLDRARRMKALSRRDPLDQTAAVSHLKPDLRGACRQSKVDFVVSEEDLNETPLATVVPNTQRPNDLLRLYRCSDLRS